VTIRPAAPGDAAAIAVIHRLSRMRAMPWLAVVHTPDEDLAFFRDKVLANQRVWVAIENDRVLGFAAATDGWLNHLYIDPHAQGAGHGGRLLQAATEGQAQVRLWTFQRNLRARAFYEGHGFAAERFTDGAGNEEREPDVLYRRDAVTAASRGRANG